MRAQKAKNNIDVHFSKELGKKPLLTHDQVIELAKRIENGDEKAKDDLVLANLRLVASIAKNHLDNSHCFTLGDLIDEGVFGLLRTIEKFDPKRGLKFSTYATYWIRQSIGRAIDYKGRTIRIPNHMMRKITKYRQVSKTFLDKFNREPLLEEVASEMGINVKEANKIRKIILNIMSLKSLIEENPGESLSYSIKADKANEDILLKAGIKKALNTLPQREREILTMRYGLEDEATYTLKEIGAKFNITKERVRQIIKRVLSKLQYNEEMSKLLE